MPKRRANGEGNIRKRKDGRWEGRYTVGHDPETGKAIIKNVLGKTQAEVKEKLKKAIEENVGIDYGRAKISNRQYTNDQLWQRIADDFKFAYDHLPDTQVEKGRPTQAADYRTALQKIEDYDYDCIL